MKNPVLPRIIADHLGSIRVTLDQNGNIDSWTDYYPFGKEARGSNTANEPKEQFTGKERDSEIGLDYFGARYYNAEIGRWVSVDPLAGKYLNVSPYNYVLNNPLLLIDPDGRHVDGAKEDVEHAVNLINQGLKEKKIDNYVAKVGEQTVEVENEETGEMETKTRYFVTYEGEGSIQANDPKLSQEENKVATDAFVKLKELIDDPNRTHTVMFGSAEKQIKINGVDLFTGYSGGARFGNNVFVDLRGNGNPHSTRFGERALGIFFHEMLGHGGHRRSANPTRYNQVFNYTKYDPSHPD